MTKSLIGLSLVSVLALANSSQASNGKVLIILSGVDHVSLKGSGVHPTGYFLSELAQAVGGLLAHGYEVVYATPTGKTPVMDKDSDSAQWFKTKEDYVAGRSLIENQKGLNSPRLFSSFNESELSTFDGVFVPGGYAPMEDLYKDKDLGKILTYFHKAKKVTALICHGPIALASTLQIQRPWIYEGYKMTIVSKVEEKQEEDAGHISGGFLNFYVQDVLTQARGVVSVNSPWTPNIVKDRELITGQNPQSAELMRDALVDALDTRK
jgi:putative intracellular protease/amidase